MLYDCTLMEKRKETIKGIKIPNYTKQIKLQYADDSHFLHISRESYEFFPKIKKASGATINLKKTKIIAINTDQITHLQERLPHITTKEQYETIKIPRIIFCEDLKQATLSNLQKILKKMQNHIRILSSRNLSFMCKAIILITLILAKTAYLSNNFPMPQEFLIQMRKLVLNYTWPHKKPIARKKLFCQKAKEV